MLSGFPPIANSNTRILILGSMPGQDSLTARQYYAHKRNAFWQIMAVLFGSPTDLSYEERLVILKENAIGVWDVIRQCQRPSSLDSAIVEKSIEVNDFRAFFTSHPKIQRLCFNGIKAEQTFTRYVLPQLPGNLHLKYIRLPSTSPANARMTFTQKLEVWKEALMIDD